MSFLKRIKLAFTMSEAQLLNFDKQDEAMPVLDGPKSYGRISSNIVVAKLKTYGITQVFMSDNLLDVTTMERAKAYQMASLIDSRDWLSEKHDCDNFSFAAMGYWSSGFESFAFGIAWSQTHAFNIMMDKNQDLWICEPQDNTWFKYEDRGGRDNDYDVVLVLM